MNATDPNPNSPTPTSIPFPHPETAADALALWDKGKTVFTIEMGGLGPGYEQCIQLLAFEMIRDNKDKPLPEPDKADNWGNETVYRCNDQVGGFSGAQVGCARTIAYRAIRDGWAKMLESAPHDRHIQVSRFWPQAPK